MQHHAQLALLKESHKAITKFQLYFLDKFTSDGQNKKFLSVWAENILEGNNALVLKFHSTKIMCQNFTKLKFQAIMPRNIKILCPVSIGVIAMESKA